MRWWIVCLLLVSGCKKEPEPPPPPPPMCAQFKHGEDQRSGEVLCARKDRDADGVDDAVDACPDIPETKNKLLDRDGCPDPDEDLDLFVDESDACPSEKGVAPDGCPLKDQDQDGIADHLDACPTRAEDIDGDGDDDGCPDGEVAVVATPLDEQLALKETFKLRGGWLKRKDVARVRLIAEEAADRDDVVKVVVVGKGKRSARRLGKVFTAAGLDDKRLTVDPAGQRGVVEVMIFVPLGGDPVVVNDEDDD